jgi:hypothetical protein
MYVRGYLQGSENGRVVTIGFRTDRSRDDTEYSTTVVSVPVWFSRQCVIIFYL